MLTSLTRLGFQDPGCRCQELSRPGLWGACRFSEPQQGPGGIWQLSKTLGSEPGLALQHPASVYAAAAVKSEQILQAACKGIAGTSYNMRGLQWSLSLGAALVQHVAIPEHKSILSCGTAHNRNHGTFRGPCLDIRKLSVCS